MYDRHKGAQLTWAYQKLLTLNTVQTKEKTKGKHIRIHMCKNTLYQI